MEKISGILSGSARVNAVDLKSSAPVRPGAPTFGRTVGNATEVQRDPRSTAEKAVDEHRRLLESRKGDEFKSAIARDLSEKFFLNKSLTQEVQPVEVSELPEAQLAPITQAPIQEPQKTPELTKENLDVPEVGHYLDVTA